MLLTKLIKENKQIIFNGNNYSDEWQKEAAKRGLLNLKNSVDAFGEVLKPEVIKAFEKYGVLNERELQARYEIALEQYNKTINIEAQLMVLMANRYILPAAYQYQGDVARSVAAVKAAGATSKEGKKRSINSSSSPTSSSRRPTSCRKRSSTRRRQRREARQVLPRQGRSGDGDAARNRRQPRDHRAARNLAAADVSRDAVHQVDDSFDIGTTRGARSDPGAFFCTFSAMVLPTSRLRHLAHWSRHSAFHRP